MSGDDVAAVAADALKLPKSTTSSSRLEAREVVVVGVASKRRKEPPPARVWMRGRWWWWGSRRNAEMDHLRLVFGSEGGDGGGSRIKTPERTTSGSRLDVREVVVVGFASKRRNGPPLAHVWTRGRWWWWGSCRNAKINHLRLAFGREGGGGGSCVETLKSTTSGSHLDTREVVVVGVASKR